MAIRVLAIYPGFDPAINEAAMAWEQLAASGEIEFLAFAPTYDQLKNNEAQASMLKKSHFAIHRIPGGYPLKLDQQAFAAAIEFNPDVVVAGTQGNLDLARKVASRVQAKLVLHQEYFYTDHCLINRKKYLGIRALLPFVANQVRAKILSRVDRVWLSDPVEVRKYAAQSPKLRYVPWPHPDPGEIIPAAGRDFSKMVYIGSLSRAKGADVLADYARKLLSVFPGKRVEIVGPATDHTGRIALRNIADDAGERFVYHPNLPRADAMQLLSRAPFVFIPGAGLSWGLIGDAWRRRTLVLAQAAHYDLVGDQNCILVHSADEFVEVVRTLEADPAFGAQILESAIQTGLKHAPSEVSKVLGTLVKEVVTQGV